MNKSLTIPVCALGLLLALPALAVPPAGLEVPQPTLPAVPPPNRHLDMPLEFFNFLRDCLIVNVNGNQRLFAAWLPMPTFIRMYGSAGGNTGQLQEKLSALKPYILFMVDNRKLDQYGNQIDESYESLKGRAVLNFPDGSQAQPLDKTPEGVPMTAPRLGMPGGDKRGQLLIFAVGDHTDLDSDTHERGKLTLTLSATREQPAASFCWRLPLELNGQTRQCLHCHNESSSKWSFCPYCGHKLP